MSNLVVEGVVPRVVADKGESLDLLLADADRVRVPKREHLNSAAVPLADVRELIEILCQQIPGQQQQLLLFPGLLQDNFMAANGY